jgi:hypothetical protein
MLGNSKQYQALEHVAVGARGTFGPAGDLRHVTSVPRASWQPHLQHRTGDGDHRQHERERDRPHQLRHLDGHRVPTSRPPAAASPGLRYGCRDLLVGRKPPCFVLRIAERAADTNVEDAAAGPDEPDLGVRSCLEDDGARLTGDGFIASRAAVFDLDLHARSPRVALGRIRLRPNRHHPLILPVGRG